MRRGPRTAFEIKQVMEIRHRIVVTPHAPLDLGPELSLLNLDDIWIPGNGWNGHLPQSTHYCRAMIPDAQLQAAKLRPTTQDTNISIDVTAVVPLRADGRDKSLQSEMLELALPW